jgi:hypothetical protein
MRTTSKCPPTWAWSHGCVQRGCMHFLNKKTNHLCECRFDPPFETKPFSWSHKLVSLLVLTAVPTRQRLRWCVDFWTTDRREERLEAHSTNSEFGSICLVCWILVTWFWLCENNPISKRLKGPSNPSYFSNEKPATTASGSWERDIERGGELPDCECEIWMPLGS